MFIVKYVFTLNALKHENVYIRAYSIWITEKERIYTGTLKIKICDYINLHKLSVYR